jgi:hypothetical protein
VIWFEAWRYQNEPSPIIALLQELCSQLPFSSKATSQLKKLAYAGFRGLIESLEEATIKPSLFGNSLGEIKLKNPLVKFREAKDKHDESSFQSRLTTDEIRNSINSAISALIAQKSTTPSRVLIIVDDLDRCEPAAAFRLLEQIKIYLNIPSCVFLLGINQRHINRAIGDNFSTSGDRDIETEKRGAEYLEKLCSVIWKLPINNSDCVTKLATQWLRPTSGNNVADQNPLPKSVVEMIGQLGSAFDCLPRNPRKLKALCNTIRQLAIQAYPRPLQPTIDIPIPPDEADALIIAATIYTFHPQLLARIQASPKFYDSLLKFSTDGLTEEKTLNWMRSHEAFRNLSLPWRDAGTKNSDEHPNPDDGSVFRVQSLLNHAVGAVDLITLESYTSPRTRGAFYERLKKFLFLQPI